MDAIKFAERMLTLLDRGSFVATYKYAVLLGLMDLCMEHTSRSGAPPAFVTTRELAEKVLELYWPHTTPFSAGGPPRVLKQTTGSQTVILKSIVGFREQLASTATSPHAARLEDPGGFEKLVRKIEWTLILMPLPRVQVVGKHEDRILYDIHWDLGIERQKRIVTRYQQGKTGPFDNRILFRPNVAEFLTMLSGLLRPLIHREWAAMVARINKLEESQLETFLFGASRSQLASVRPHLRELQDNRCFYCEKSLEKSVEVDHFIPWARYPDDGIENLVASHRRCNNKKRDFLAATGHVAKWAERNKPESVSATSLEHIAERARWERHPVRTLGVARAIYYRLPPETRLWRQEDEFEPLEPRIVRAVLEQSV